MQRPEACAYRLSAHYPHHVDDTVDRLRSILLHSMGNYTALRAEGVELCLGTACYRICVAAANGQAAALDFVRKLHLILTSEREAVKNGTYVPPPVKIVSPAPDEEIKVSPNAARKLKMSTKRLAPDGVKYVKMKMTPKSLLKRRYRFQLRSASSSPKSSRSLFTDSKHS